MEMQLASERRTSRRAAVVECQVVREHGFVLLAAQGIDLSAEGMLVPTRAHAVVGEALIVSFCVPGTRTWVDTTATVARVVHGYRHHDEGRALGLAFAPLDAEESRLVRWALRRFPPTFPARAVRVDYAATAALIALA
jgi:PilZ domain